MHQGYVSIGSNIDKDKYIPASLDALKKHFGTLTISSIYESEAIGFKGDTFYNLIVGFKSALDVKETAKTLRQIELDNGRTSDSQKFSSRTLDLDLILYDDMIINDGKLQIPRDEIEKYAFVLEPLAEIAPDLKHPISRLSYENIWKHYDKTKNTKRNVTYRH